MTKLRNGYQREGEVQSKGARAPLVRLAMFEGRVDQGRRLAK